MACGFERKQGEDALKLVWLLISRATPVAIAPVLILTLLTTTGCTSVAYHEKAKLVSPIMAFDEGPTEIHFYQKTYYSREGSIGGIGTTAGGGCGCY